MLIHSVTFDTQLIFPHTVTGISFIYLAVSKLSHIKVNLTIYSCICAYENKRACVYRKGLTANIFDIGLPWNFYLTNFHQLFMEQMHPQNLCRISFKHVITKSISMWSAIKSGLQKFLLFNLAVVATFLNNSPPIIVMSAPVSMIHELASLVSPHLHIVVCSLHHWLRWC